MPHIVSMWEQYGAVYARHVYGGDLVDSNGVPTDDPPGNPQRPFLEADYLRSIGYGGGMVLAECGIDGGYGLADYGRFRAQALGYAEALRPYADIIIGLCFWECGTSGFEANYTGHLMDLRPLLDTSLPKWEGKESEDMTPKECDLYLDLGRFVHLLPQDTTDDEIATIAVKFNASRNSFVYSHDDAELIIAHGRGQNSEGKRVSEVKIWEPQRFSFDVTGYFASKGYMYTVGYFAGEPEPSNPLTGLKLGYLFEYQYSDNYSPFNAPRDYDGDGIFDDRHEGLDADVIGGNVDNRVNVLCVYDGTVDRSLDSTGNYGKYVRIAHVRNGSTFYTRYCHLDTRLVQVGATIRNGDPVGEVGDTGYVSGEHVHFNLEVPGYGLSGYVVADVVDPYPYLPKDNMSLPPPPSGNKINLAKYFQGNGQQYQRLFEVETKVNGTSRGQQRHQLQIQNGRIYFVKGGDGSAVKAQWEELRIYNGFIQRWRDFSFSATDWYEVGSSWANWMPVSMAVGEVFTSQAAISHYNKTNCLRWSGPTNTTDYLKLAAVHGTYNGYNGIVLNDVIEVHWSKSPSFGVIEEIYFFSADIDAPGLCGWKNTRDGRDARPSELHQSGQRPNSVMDTPGCLLKPPMGSW